MRFDQYHHMLNLDELILKVWLILNRLKVDWEGTELISFEIY
ncbi:hypothetical protein J2X77_004300 [Sphingobacterium sp. 2149]|nr:hypothetical protein [Sphingobacterium sp. 2149]